ncbi:alpha,alpha-phosphotrehalase [Agathobacter ruminis]|uniref:Alpha,alpha-phosphotrehalase n=1 Tax=Agathobacter ruminis TaxID=1712665 RepID=A0A2G3E2F4_9FIRM|nr:alpha,alpha-phosphotrehalase [Agathobacter ruminis]MDC7300903.1 alpha,alpha-phosphotrehalase [Agathobacter ruminis]PHU37452.1 alpha,alpha-phosphotrehalase [Agathobacter ruminis]
MSDFKDKVVYQIYPRSFYDTNADGVGDLRGITEKLDYLKLLGVDYIWITPFFVSPQRDNGYDIADYRAIDPRFGTMQDFEELSAQAKLRGIGIMLDMVFNHTSTEHEWFQKAIAGDPKYMDYYIFRDGTKDCPPTNWQSKFGGNAWAFLPELQKWYLHLFDVTQADLNWKNPLVREELKEIIRFWKAKGVSGFRFDVINLISKPDLFEDDNEGDGRRFYTDGKHVHEYLKELVRDTGIADMITVGEMSSTTVENCIRYSNPAEKELSMCFHFHHLKVDYRDGDKWKLMPYDKKALTNLLRTWQERMQEGGGWSAVFWTNHDQPRTISRFGDEKEYWAQSGKMLAGLIHMMRGTPYIYQGEEIGMLNTHFDSITQYRDVESLNYYKILCGNGLTEQEALTVLGARSRDNGRTPMQWNGEKNAGFSEHEPWIAVPSSDYKVTVEAQKDDPDSIFSFYQTLIRLRKEHPAISHGTIEFQNTGTEQVMAYLRKSADEKIAIFANLSAESIEADLPEGAWETILLSNYEEKPLRRAGRVTLRPYEFVAYTD